MTGGGKEVLVVRVDLPKAVFLGAGEVEGVGGPEKHGCWERGKVTARELQQLLVDGKPRPQPVAHVVGQLGYESFVGLGIKPAFTQFAVERRLQLQAGQGEQGDARLAVQELSDLLAPRLV